MSEITQATQAAYPPAISQHPRTLSTVRQFSEKNPAFSQGSIRNLIHLSTERYSSKGKIPDKGLDMALIRIGRKIIIDDQKFFQWIDAQNRAVK